MALARKLTSKICKWMHSITSRMRFQWFAMQLKTKEKPTHKVTCKICITIWIMGQNTQCCICDFVMVIYRRFCTPIHHFRKKRRIVCERLFFYMFSIKWFALLFIGSGCVYVTDLNKKTCRTFFQMKYKPTHRKWHVWIWEKRAECWLLADKTEMSIYGHLEMKNALW